MHAFLNRTNGPTILHKMLKRAVWHVNFSHGSSVMHVDARAMQKAGNFHDKLIPLSRGGSWRYDLVTNAADRRDRRTSKYRAYGPQTREPLML